MAITTNTTKSIKMASAALGARCDNTEKNMAALIKRAGVKTAPKMTSVLLPLIPGSHDDVAVVGLNGVTFYLRRGKTLELPAEIIEILHNTGNL